MDLRHALRTTPAAREFTDRSITDHELAEILDDARFAPSGGNRQAWHVVVVKDRSIRRTLRDLYLEGMGRYLAQVSAGLVPFNPYSDPQREADANASALDLSEAESTAYGFSSHLEDAPALLAVFADLRALATVDRDLDRYTFVGGASIYPFCWNILLAARERGLGGVMTTMPVYREPDVLDLMNAPEGFALATLMVMGEPQREVMRLKRGAVSSFATIDTLTGPSLPDPS